MAEVKIFKRIDPNDVVVNKFEAYKTWSFDESNYTSSSLISEQDMHIMTENGLFQLEPETTDI